MLDLGIIGLGAWGLCVLERAIRCAQSTDCQIRIHAVEPGVIGGTQYDPAQPDYLILNNACGQLSLYANPDDGPTPRYGLSLFEWASRSGYQWFGDECRIADGGRPVQPGDYLPRRLMGEYLSWFYETALQELPGNVQFVRYRSAVVDLTPVAADREQMVLADGTSVVVDHVILTSGHTPNRDGAVRAGDVVSMQPYPMTQLQSSPAPGKSVAISGMGLVAYDVLTALSIGRGGHFVDAGDRKIYQPTGREPRISLYSRSGVPYCAKSASGIDPTGEYRPVVCTAEAFAAIRGTVDARPARPVDLRRELLPLLFTEMRARYYIHAATLDGGLALADRVRGELQRAWIRGRFDEVAAGLSLRYGSFDPETHVFAGADRSYASAADYEKQFYAMVESDLDEAVMPTGSPVKAAQEVLRILRDDIRSIIEFGGLSLESHLDFTRNVKGRINRLEAGPPVLRSQQLLALMDAGIVEVPFGPAPKVSAAPSGHALIESTQLDIPYAAMVSSVIRGHLDMPSLANSASPLLVRLYRRGRLTQLRYGDTPVGSVAISDDFHPFDIEGRLQRTMSVFGVLTEGSRYFTHYLPSPRSRLRAVLDAQACVERLLAA